MAYITHEFISFETTTPSVLHTYQTAPQPPRSSESCLISSCTRHPFLIPVCFADGRPFSPSQRRVFPRRKSGISWQYLPNWALMFGDLPVIRSDLRARLRTCLCRSFQEAYEGSIVQCTIYALLYSTPGVRTRCPIVSRLEMGPGK